MNVLCCEQSADPEKQRLLLYYNLDGKDFFIPRNSSGALDSLHYTKSS